MSSVEICLSLSRGMPFAIPAEFEPTPPPTIESTVIHIPCPARHRFCVCELAWVPWCWRVVCVARGVVFSFGHGAVKILYKFWGLLLMEWKRPTLKNCAVNNNRRLTNWSVGSLRITTAISKRTWSTSKLNWRIWYTNRIKLCRKVEG